MFFKVNFDNIEMSFEAETEEEFYAAHKLVKKAILNLRTDALKADVSHAESTARNKKPKADTQEEYSQDYIKHDNNKQLTGLATDKQKDLLRRKGIPFNEETLTKQQASEMIENLHRNPRSSGRRSIE